MRTESLRPKYFAYSDHVSRSHILTVLRLLVPFRDIPSKIVYLLAFS